MAQETLTLLFGRKGAKIGELQLDATIRESHKYDAEITDYPVEEGFDINDNIRKMPEQYDMEGIVTNSPISGITDFVVDIVTGNTNFSEVISNLRVDKQTRVEVAQNILLELAGRKIQGKQENDIPKVFDIITGLRVFNNMAIKNLEFPRDGQTGEALRIVATFKKINVTTTETVAIPSPQAAVEDKTQSNVSKNKVEKKEATPVQTKKVSTVKSFFNTLGGG